MALKRSVETVGRNIHRIAFDKRVTQKDLAEAAGIAEGVMSKIIHGDHTPSLRVSMSPPTKKRTFVYRQRCVF